MKRTPTPLGVTVSCVLMSLLIGLSGCSQTRAQKLASKADDVSDALVAERDRVLELAPGAERSDRLDHLKSLQMQLRAANISRAAAPRLLEADQVDMAYDVLEEVYGTIDWNIPLGASDPSAKSLPAAFGATGLNFSSLKSTTPATPGIAPANK